MKKQLVKKAEKVGARVKYQHHGGEIQRRLNLKIPASLFEKMMKKRREQGVTMREQILRAVGVEFIDEKEVKKGDDKCDTPGRYLKNEERR